MRLFKPQLNLTCKADGNGGLNYYIYAVTHFDTTKYIADGVQNISGVPDSDGVYRVTLQVKEQEQDLTLHYLNPVVHTVSIGKIQSNGKPAKIEVEIRNGGQLLGKSSINDDMPDLDGKPDLG